MFLPQSNTTNYNIKTMKFYLFLTTAATIVSHLLAQQPVSSHLEISVKWENQDPSLDGLCTKQQLGVFGEGFMERLNKGVTDAGLPQPDWHYQSYVPARKLRGDGEGATDKKADRHLQWGNCASCTSSCGYACNWRRRLTQAEEATAHEFASELEQNLKNICNLVVKSDLNTALGGCSRLIAAAGCTAVVKVA